MYNIVDKLCWFHALYNCYGVYYGLSSLQIGHGLIISPHLILECLLWPRRGAPIVITVSIRHDNDLLMRFVASSTLIGSTNQIRVECRCATYSSFSLSTP